MGVVLQTRLSHMAGQTLTVNGVAVSIDADCRCTVDDSIAKKILASRNWRVVGGGGTAKPKVVVAPQAAPKKPEVVETNPIELKAEMSEANVDVGYEDPPVPADGEAWPDPTAEMSMPYLRLMAKAYEVSVGGNMKKETLLQRLNAAMFEQVEG